MLYTKEQLRKKMEQLPYYILKTYLEVWKASLSTMTSAGMKEELKIYISVLEELIEDG